MSHVSTQELVERAKSGDRRAFDALVARSRPRIVSVVSGVLRNHEDVQDVVQNSFLSAWMNLHRFDASSQFETWLYRIAFNASIDHLRARRRRPSDPLDESHTRALEGPSDPFRDAHGRDVASVFSRALDTLSLEHYVVIVLREVEELSYADIAERIEIPEGTVMSRLFHARRELQAAVRRLLGDEWRDSIY